MSKSRDIADSAATINFIDGVTSDVQTQLDSSATAGLATAGPITTPVVTANSIVATVSATLGAVGDVTITGGTADQYLQTDGSGNLSFADVATGGTTVCATTLQSCASPVLNLAAGNYFKIRATGNTHVEVTGSGTSLTIDYLSNCYGVLNLPNSFITNDSTANTITDLAINNQYLLEYNKVGSQWTGGVKHIAFHPSCETKHSVSKGYSPNNNWQVSTNLSNYPNHCERVEHPIFGSYTCGFPLSSIFEFQGLVGGGTLENGRCGIQSNQTRSLTFTYKNKPYTIVPSYINNYCLSDNCTCICTMPLGCAHDAKGIVLGYDTCGFACKHQLVDYYTNQTCGACSHPKVYRPCSVAMGGFSVECCVNNRCVPVEGKAGTFRPIAVWPSKNLLISAELLYVCNRCSKAMYKCLDLEAFVERGEYRDKSSEPCELFSTGERCNVCYNDMWTTFSVNPNVDFDKGHTAVIAYLDPTKEHTCAHAIFTKISPCSGVDDQYPSSASNCHMLCFCSNRHDLRIAGGQVSCRMWIGGQGLCQNDCLGHELVGSFTMTANAEYIAAVGMTCLTNHCWTNKVAIFRDCTYGTAVNTFTNIGNCCHITRYCGNTGSLQYHKPLVHWDCQLCHIAVVSRKNDCCNGFGMSVIYSRNSGGTAYDRTYCCCWCTDCNMDQNTYVCCNDWPVGGASKCGPVIAEIEIGGSCHCIYSSSASATCDSACSCNLCGLNYDTGSCTWTIGHQNFNTDCGANTAPDKLFWNTGEYTRGTYCNCGMQCGITHTLNSVVVAGRDSSGAYMNPRAIHPLSNTELYSI